MTIRTLVTLLLIGGLFALLFYTFRTGCPGDQAQSASRVSARTEANQHTTDPQPQPLARHDDATPQLSAIQRNIFTYAETPVHVVREPVVKIAPAVIPPNIAEQPDAPPTREPEFPYRYIGRFGLDSDQIAVFVGNGEVVNARAGETVAGQFRVRGVGVESVDVLCASGAIRRVVLQP